MADNRALQHATSNDVGPAPPPSLDISADVSRRLRAAGRPGEEADAAGQLIAAHYQARAARYEFQRGTAADMYRTEAPDIAGPQSGDRGKVQGDDHTLFQSASGPVHETTGLPHLYSGVARAVNELTQAKGTGEQMAAMLSRVPGVKPEEMKWLGLDSWLKGQTSVSKEQIQDYVRANSLQLHEITQKGARTQFGSYALPGGRDYREVLIRLPQAERPQFSEGWEPREMADGKGWNLYNPDPEVGWAFTGGRSGQAELMQFVRKEYPMFLTSYDAPKYHSGHWEPENVLAHARLAEHSAPDGKRVLLIEEIQSDWHQAGRKGGYQTGDDITGHPLKATWTGGATGVWEVRTESGKYITNVTKTAAETEQDALAVARQRIAADRSRVGQDDRVPDAPFKTSWPTLAMKRMIAYAVDHGFDRVAWPPGEVQSDRYNLSKRVSKLRYFPEEREFYADDRTGNQVISKVDVGPENLSGLIGREAAEKLLAAKRIPIDGTGSTVQRIDGLDLNIPAEGMKGFYDNILPKETQKLVGKFGARVGTSEIPRCVTQQQRESVEPDAEALAKYGEQFDRLKAEAQDANRRAMMSALGAPGASAVLRGWQTLDGGPDKKTPDDDRADALFQQLAELRNRMIEETIARQRQSVHSFDVTDDLRRAVLESGLTLFQENRGQIRFNDGRSVITLFGQADASTFLHETAHEWLRELLRDAAHPQAPVSLTNDAATVREWLGAGPDGPITRQQHERFARAFERYMMEGQAPSAALAEVFAKFRDWLVSLYQTVERLGSPITPEIRAVFDRMLTAAPDRQPAAAPADDLGQNEGLSGGAVPIGPRSPGAASHTATAGGGADPQAGGQPPQADRQERGEAPFQGAITSPAGASRSVLIDTETTGLELNGGHRVIEVAALELVNDLPTGRHFHALLDPERDIPEEAVRIHGITNAHVAGKPRFAEIADELLAFLGDSKLIAHNAPFDLAFLGSELGRLGLPPPDPSRMIDTLEMARARFPGLPNSLDALCRRFAIDPSARTTHNALLDCKLLAEVYIELTGGRQRSLSLAAETAAAPVVAYAEAGQRTPRPIEPSARELAAHAAFMRELKEPLWDSGAGGATGPAVPGPPAATSHTIAAGSGDDPRAGRRPPQADQQRPVLDTLLAVLREPGGLSLGDPAVAATDRLAAFEKRMSNERDEAAFQGAIASGRAALDALQTLGNGGGAAIMGRIRQAAASDPEGRAGVVSEMREGGRFAGLLGQFNTALDSDRALAGAYDCAAAALYRYGKDRAAVEDIIGRRTDGDAISARFQPMDSAIGEAAVATPSRNGRDMLDDPVQKAADLLRRAAEAVAPAPGAPAGTRYTASASMSQ